MSTRYSSGVKSAPRSGYNFLQDRMQRLRRSDILAKTARETGKRALLPEFGCFLQKRLQISCNAANLQKPLLL